MEVLFLTLIYFSQNLEFSKWPIRAFAGCRSYQLIIDIIILAVEHGAEKSSAECYSVLCPFLTKMSIIYRWNQHQMFYLQSSLDVAYHISVRIYKLFNLASLPKNDFTLVLYCSMSILNQWNASIKKGLVTWLLRSHEHILLCHWFSTTIHQLSQDEETDSGEKQSTSIYIIKQSSSHPRWVYLDNVCII